MLKSLPSHLSCSCLIQDYLERKGRWVEKGHIVLERDFINLYSDNERGAWAQVMDKTRKLAGNDRAWGDKKAVTYQHFIISPDPKDGIDLETLQSLSMQWAEEMFGYDLDYQGGQDRVGRLGAYEVAIVYHDDNEKGIPHAHVVVNNTNLVTGKRLQISKKDSAMLADRLQNISREHGLNHFDNSIPKQDRRSVGSYLSRTERELLRRDKFSWKQDLRDKITIARRLSKNEQEYLKRLEVLGVKTDTVSKFTFSAANLTEDQKERIEAEFADVCYKSGANKLSSTFYVEARDELSYIAALELADRFGLRVDNETCDYLYHHKKNIRWQAFGYALGRNYDRNGVSFAQDKVSRESKTISAECIKAIDNLLNETDIDVIVYDEQDTTIKDLARMLKTNDRYAVDSYAHYDKLLCDYAIKIKRATATNSKYLDNYKKAYRDLSQAKNLAHKIGLFDEVAVKTAKAKVSNRAETSKPIKKSSKKNASSGLSRKKQRRTRQAKTNQPKR